MTSEEKENFIKYWEVKRVQNKWNPFLFIKGFSIGLSGGLFIVLLIGANWYQRANMVANTRLNVTVLFIAIFLIAFFCAVLYNNFKWEQLEQQYLEFLEQKKKKDK